MKEINMAFHYHQVVSTLICYWFFSSVVSSLPTPMDNSGMFYKFFFKFMQTLSANLMRIPEVRTLVGASSDVNSPPGNVKVP